MKKLLLSIMLIAFVVVLGACSPSTDYVEQSEYDELEQRVQALETTLDNLVCSVGLNGQYDCYINESESNATVFLSLSDYQTLTSEKDYIDSSKFPSYIFDEYGEYININALGNLLTQKYLGVSSTSTTGYTYIIDLDIPEGMTNEEFMARVCMMIIELSNYDFYTIDSPELYINFIDGGSQYMKVRMSLLVSDKYELHPAIFWNGLMDTRIVGITYDIPTVQAYYDDFILNGTFDGFVLNY